MTSGAVLIVDDDDDTREAISELLLEEGVQVLTACDGREALAVLRRHPHDVALVVLDLMMPVMDGAEFRIQQLKERALAAIPFVLLTGRADCTHMAQALGAVACIRKPFEPEALLAALRDTLSLRDETQAS